MEIKIFETEKTLRIEKHCPKEQFLYRVFLIISYIVYLHYEYENGNINIFIIMPIIMIYVAYRIITLKYMYEIIFVDDEKIYFSTSYNSKILSKKEYQRKYNLNNLKLIYPWIFLEPRYITSKTEQKNYLSRVHFDFDGEKKYDSWGACISIEEAGKIVERINNFLEKNNKFL